MKFAYLASGSGGNCLAVWAGTPPIGILVDFGLSATQIAKRMRMRDIDPAWFGAVLVSQAHKDHTRGLSVWATRHAGVIYATRQTVETLDVPSSCCNRIQPGDTFGVAGFRVTVVPVVHDNMAGGAVGEETGAVTFMVERDGANLALLYESGRITFEMAGAAHEATALLIEANHCAQMLASVYHPSLAERVACTHLSNQQAAEYLATLDDRTKIVVAVHRSLHTNDPELVRSTLQDALDVAGSKAALVLAEQDSATPVFEICSLESKKLEAP